jgi:cytochrome c-type biogenesis protein CcmH/NrfF
MAVFINLDDSHPVLEHEWNIWVGPFCFLVVASPIYLFLARRASKKRSFVELNPLAKEIADSL